MISAIFQSGGVVLNVISCRGLAISSMGYLDAQEGSSSRSAFRLAEKRYKKYKQSSTHLRNSKCRSKAVPPTDVSQVLDPHMYSEALLTDKSLKIDGVSLATSQFDTPVLVIEGYPGFYVIPGALSVQEQYFWIQESLASFPQPPNRTNHNALYGHIRDLWSNAQEKHVLTEKQGNQSDSLDTDPPLQQQKPSKPPPLDDDGHTVAAENRIKGLESDGAGRAGSIIGNLPDDEALDHHVPSNGAAMDETHNKEYVSTRARVVNHSPETIGNKEWHFVSANEARSSSSTTGLPSSKPISAEALLRKLRWATIGLHFDWAEKAYNPTIPHKKLSQELARLASRLAAPAMNGDNFKAEAAIVNYYGADDMLGGHIDDMLGGHIDDMEADWTKPIVSISLGCKAVFLLGGTSRDEGPVAMFLRSGDVILMAGPARQRFHGIPRIFVDSNESDLPDFSEVAKGDDARPFFDYISKSRININIRQVF